MTIKLLVVDDSALMRRTIRQAFESLDDFDVRHARDGEAALKQIASDPPDVVTLDINMPVMDGLTCLSHIMTRHPLPVIMVSSLTEKGALATFEALEMGAVDYIPKPDGTVSLRLNEVMPLLVDKVRAAVHAKPASSAVRRTRLIREQKRRESQGQTPTQRYQSSPDRIQRTWEGKVPGVVLIGVSTGGPRTMEDILPRLPVDFPYPIIVAQHMPERFTRVFAERMNECCAITIKEATEAEPLRPGTVYIGKGGGDVVLERRLGRVVVAPAPEDGNPWHPSVTRLVRSAEALFSPSEIICIQLTGMGDDGAAAIADLHQRGAYTIAESEDSCVVFGMPRALIEARGASVILESSDIAEHLMSRLSPAGRMMPVGRFG